jgi:hypothetical protein
MAKKNWIAYWKFMIAKALRTGLQSAIALYLANSSGIIDAEIMQLIAVSFLSSALTVLQHALEQYKPKATFDT